MMKELIEIKAFWILNIFIGIVAITFGVLEDWNFLVLTGTAGLASSAFCFGVLMGEDGF
jgi:hypothetical protein